MRRGDFHFGNMPRVYCVGILVHSIFPSLPGYHQHLNLRNAEGALLDQQLHFITVELAKFDEAAPIVTDLQKLLHLMKSLNKLRDVQDFPLFYREQWIREAIEELDRTAMTADERMYLEMSIVREVAVLDGHRTALAEALEEDKAEGARETIRLMLRNSNLSVEEIARYTGNTVAYVAALKADLS